MVSLHLIFYACLDFRFPDVETNPGPDVLFLRPVEYSVVMCGPFQEPERCDSGFVSVWFVVVLWDPGLGLASYIIIKLLKKVSSARLGKSDIHPICPKTPAPQ